MPDKSLIGKGIHPASGPSLTSQADRQSTDINAMAGKYLKHRLAGNPAGRQPMYMEVPSLTYHEMLNKVTKIKDTFGRLPARIRSRFHNQPGVLISWLEDPDNRREAVSLGLIIDPELSYQMEEEERRKASGKVVQTDLEDASGFISDEPASASKADPEAQPSRSAPPAKGGKKGS